MQHPLQPFDPRNFTPGALVPGQTWGFDRVTLQGAQALEAPRSAPAPFLPGPLPARPAALVELDELVRFAERPVRAFLRQRLGISLWEEDDEVAEALSVELDPLERYGVGARVLEARLAGSALEACLAAERARGLLPPGRLGDVVLDRVGPEVDAIATAAAREAEGGAGAMDVRVTVDGVQLGGTVGGVHGGRLLVARYSRVNARQRIATWLRWLALSAAYPEHGFEAVLIGRAAATADEPVRTVRYAAIEAGLAREHLAILLDLYARGLREALPLATAPAAAYVERGEDAARRDWDSRFKFDGEDKRLEHRQAFGGVRSFDELLGERPRDGERWYPDEPSRFGQLARRLWTGVQACEATP